MSKTLVKKINKNNLKYKKGANNSDEEQDLYLTYEFSTSPSPIVVTPLNSEGGHLKEENEKDGGIRSVVSKADISLVITNEKKAKEFSSIVITLPLGSQDDREKYKDTEKLANGKDKIKHIFPDGQINGLDVFCSESSYIIKREDDESFEIKKGESIFVVFHCNEVSSKVGNFLIDVREEVETQESEIEKVEAQFSFGKFPYGFYLKNFRSECPIINYGGETTLRWEGAKNNSTEYTICANTPIPGEDDNTTNNDEYEERTSFSEDNSCFKDTQTKYKQATGKLERTTFYTLKASYKIIDQEDPAYYYLQTAVYVMDSDISATNIKAESIEVEKNVKAKSIDVKEYAKINDTLYVDNVKATKEYKENTNNKDES